MAAYIHGMSCRNSSSGLATCPGGALFIPSSGHSLTGCSCGCVVFSISLGLLQLDCRVGSIAGSARKCLALSVCFVQQSCAASGCSPPLCGLAYFTEDPCVDAFPFALCITHCVHAPKAPNCICCVAAFTQQATVLVVQLAVDTTHMKRLGGGRLFS